MKKIFIIFMILVLMCCLLTGCGNMLLDLGDFTFNHIHFTDHLNNHCATIEKWYDNANGIEVKTKEYGSMYLSEGSYILFEEAQDCPYCEVIK